MRVSAFASFLLLLVSTVFAAGDASSSQASLAGSSSRRPRPIYESQTQVVAEREWHATYAQRLRHLLKDKLQLGDITVGSLTHAPVSETELLADIYHDPDTARFYYMGHSSFGQPDMVFFTPITGHTRTDGSQVFALLSKRKKGPMHLHGYVAVSRPEKIKRAMRTWIPDLYLVLEARAPYRLEYACAIA
ncbi:uncharacterized protein UTRI_06240 [Ustilago trichophora]|uniref:Uncharacterized protein n=1 Tax=Ustilago trichophora TaxID=86804 RepID=A0A5C3EIF8_9BASI|nr:uncharacterized protein UTRI_06240 [Ustilago trichophora]